MGQEDLGGERTGIREETGKGEGTNIGMTEGILEAQQNGDRESRMERQSKEGRGDGRGKEGDRDRERDK